LISVKIDQAELSPYVTYTFKQHCEQDGYPYEEYSVTTDDGYILSLYRIPGKNKNPGPPVLLVHGLSNSAHCFILNQCTTPPAFRLADENYDVWLGNNRGSHLSREHTNLDPNSHEYWDWSVAEVIEYDLPPLVKFVKEKTGYEKIGIFSHSQGSGAVLWMLSLYPEMKNDVAIAILSATPGGVSKPESFYINLLATSLVHNIFDLLGMKIWSDWTDDLSFAKFIATFPTISSWIGSDVFDMSLHGGNKELHLPVYVHRIRGGTSIKNLKFMRQYQVNSATKPYLYDYGKEGNLKKYGTETPPVVDFKKCQTPLAVMNGKYDLVVPQKDSILLKESLNQDMLVFYKDDYEQDHGGFLMSCNMSYFDDAIRLFRSYLKPK